MTESQTLALLVFRLSDQFYALSVVDVYEVVGMVNYVQLPGADSALLGLVNRRGSPMPLLDLRRAFGMAAASPCASDLFIVVTVGEQFLGLIVDEVLHVLHVSVADLSPAQNADERVSHIVHDGQQIYQLINSSALAAAFVEPAHPMLDLNG